MIRIIVIDDQPSDLNCIHTLLSSQPDFEVVGFMRDGYDALKLAGTRRPDIIILDINQQIEGPEFASLLKRWSPGSAIILFTASENDAYISRAISSGVSGYLLKKTDKGKLPAAIRYVFKGGHYITPEITGRAFKMFSVLMRSQSKGAAVYPSRNIPSWLDRAEPFPQNEGPVSFPPNISRTEYKIICFLAQGRSNKEIAEDLSLNIGTVRNYISSVLRKAGLHNRTQMAIFALRNGLA